VGGTGWCETNILQNINRKCGGTWQIISPLSEKMGGRVPPVSHLIAPMIVPKGTLNNFNLWFWVPISGSLPRSSNFNIRPCFHFADNYFKRWY